MKIKLSKIIEANSMEDAELEYNENIPEFGDWTCEVLEDSEQPVDAE